MIFVFLLSLILTGPASAPAGAPPDWESFFPFRLGDSWTYDWQTRGPYARLQQSSRTRVFEGTEFVHAGLAYKLISEDGSYHLYTVHEGELAIHGSSEEGRLYIYDPPVILAARDWKPGQQRVVEHAANSRRWTTTHLGYEDVTVPMGTFRQCLKVRLQMESPEYVSDSVHHFARQVGLVAYSYQVRDREKDRKLIEVTAGLRLARLAGRAVSGIEDLAALSRAETVSLGSVDDPESRKAFQRALENRYTWKEDFPGFTGDFEYHRDGQAPACGTFSITADFIVRVDSDDEAVRARLRNEFSSFVAHRRHLDFDVQYAQTSFGKSQQVAAGASRHIRVDGDAMGTAYQLQDGWIRSVSRSYGRLRYVTRNLANLRTDEGKYITVDYDLTYYSNEDGSLVSAEHTTDSYARVGNYWLPTGRKTVVKTTEDGGDSTTELRLLNLRLQQPRR